MAETPKAANDAGAKPAPSSISQVPLLYQDPKPMDVAVFAKFGLKRGSSFKFAAKTNVLPITVGEFQHAQKSYPIVFGGDPVVPMIALGFQQGENLFVMADGKWAEDTYVPSYLRRYPFVLAQVQGEERLYLCADTKAEMVTDQSPDLPFFVDGKATEVVNQALEVCRTFQEDFILTRAFCDELQKNNLLRSAELRFNLPDGRQQSVGTFISIDQPAFDALPDGVILDFRKRGLLPLIYMQMASQGNWNRLTFRKDRATPQAPAKV